MFNVFQKTIIISFLILFSCFSPAIFAQPKISIIIDDLGNDPAAGLAVANLPGSVVCSILPEVEFSKQLAEQCHHQHKEIILHTPMQALIPHRLGPGGLYVDMNKNDFLTTLNTDIKAVPYIIGLNNHEGSRLTEAANGMNWLMQDIKPQGLFFIDSVTSPHTIAEKIARQAGVATTHRDVFLDDIPTQAAVREQFNLLLAVAEEKGHAVAIGHPYPATIAVLKQELPRLAQAGYELVPISQIINEKAAANKNVPLPLLNQVWQQVTAGNAGFDPLTVIQLQLATVKQNNNVAITEQPKRIPIRLNATKPLLKNQQVVDKNPKTNPTIIAQQALNSSNLLRNDFCSEYPNLCYLLPKENS